MVRLTTAGQVDFTFNISMDVLGLTRVAAVTVQTTHDDEPAFIRTAMDQAWDMFVIFKLKPLVRNFVEDAIEEYAGYVAEGRADWVFGVGDVDATGAPSPA